MEEYSVQVRRGTGSFCVRCSILGSTLFLRVGGRVFLTVCLGVSGRDGLGGRREYCQHYTPVVPRVKGIPNPSGSVSPDTLTTEDLRTWVPGGTTDTNLYRHEIGLYVCSFSFHRSFVLFSLPTTLRGSVVVLGSRTSRPGLRSPVRRYLWCHDPTRLHSGLGREYSLFPCKPGVSFTEQVVVTPVVDRLGPIPGSQRPTNRRCERDTVELPMSRGTRPSPIPLEDSTGLRDQFRETPVSLSGGP